MRPIRPREIPCKQRNFANSPAQSPSNDHPHCRQIKHLHIDSSALRTAEFFPLLGARAEEFFVGAAESPKSLIKAAGDAAQRDAEDEIDQHDKSGG